MTEEKFKKPKKWLNIPQCEIIYERFRLLQPSLIPDGEPLPPFRTRYSGSLESILGSVQFISETFSYDVVKTAVCYYVKLATSQAFFNGNKRMSVVMSGLFLYRNNLYLTHGVRDFADLTLQVSEDKQTPPEEKIEIVTPFFETLVKPLK